MDSSLPSPAIPFPKQTRRLSRFVEGSESTGHDLLVGPSSSASHLLSVLSQMDEFERRTRQHSGSAASVESFTSTQSSLKANHHTTDAHMEGVMLGAIEGKRVVSFGSAVSSSSERSRSSDQKRSWRWSNSSGDEFRSRPGSRAENEPSTVESVVRSWADRWRTFMVGKGARRVEPYVLT